MKTIRELRLYPTPEQADSLRATMLAMNAASNEAAYIGLANKSFTQVGLHHLAYRTLREKFNLPAQMAVRAISKPVNVFARDRRYCPTFRPMGAVAYDARMLTHKSAARSVSVLTLAGRALVPYRTAERNSEALKGKWGEAKLVHREGAFYLQVSVEQAEEAPLEVGRTIGVDLGLRNIATLSTGQTFSGEAVQNVRKRYARVRAELQSKGTRSARRKFRKVSGREARFVRGVNHVIARRIVELAKALRARLVLEDLTGIRRKRSGVKALRTLLNSWSFHQLRSFITYKALLAGVPIEVVKPAFTSQTCAQCGHCEKANRRGASFKCKACGHADDSDRNAAVNIARLGERQTAGAAGTGRCQPAYCAVAA